MSADFDEKLWRPFYGEFCRAALTTGHHVQSKGCICH